MKIATPLSALNKDLRAAIRSGLIALLLILTACFPFGTQERTIAGPFRFLKWEDGTTFYLVQKGQKSSGGGVLEGTVQQIGWNDQFIIAKRHSLIRGDPNNPDGWMIVNLNTKTIHGPLSEAELANKAEVSEIQIFSPAEAWSNL